MQCLYRVRSTLHPRNLKTRQSPVILGLCVMKSSHAYRLACVAGGIVSAREIKFWRRSRQANGKAAKRMGSGRLLLATPPPKLYFARAYNTAGYAGYYRHVIVFEKLRF